MSYHDNNHLYGLLKNLEYTEEYNILLLGGTGVGKSTFLNAFVNYLAFDSLSDALSEPESFRFLIPGSFYYGVRVDNKSESYSVSFGEETDSQKFSAEGESATRNTIIYTVYCRRSNRIIRFIDTPGICDTRGIDQDYKNVRDILAALESVDKLSTILFLLPTNESRLTPAVKFCITELLCHLHRDACKNLIFGFTHASGTGFAQGDTHVTLTKVLGLLRTGISLGSHNQFFFDSRCFQFLAASKQLRRLMPDKDRCERMRTESAKAASSLIEQTVRLPVHQVSKTLSLHRVRKHLQEMVMPLARFTTAMKMTEANLEEKKKEFGELDLMKEDLNEKLKNNKIIYFVPVRNNLQRPRTVCGDERCLEVKIDGAGSQHNTYRENCHSNCYLDTPNEVMGTPELAGCFAFNNRGDICIACGHDWMKHLHVSYNLTFKEVSKDDDRISTKIKSTEEAKEAAHLRLEEYENDLRSIKKELGLISGA